MKKNKLYLICTILVLTLLICSCQNQPAPNVTTVPPLATEEIVTIPTNDTLPSLSLFKKGTSKELLTLLPQDIGFTWFYSGFAEYGHIMTLDDITTDRKTCNTIYHISGMVDDVSGGESKKDYSMTVKYTVTDKSIIQKICGEMVLDTDFEKIELIRLPLKKGNSWNQKVKYKKGKKTVLHTTIEDIVVKNGAKTYTIVYKDKNSDYFERRTIQENIGVVSFEKLYIPKKDKPFVIGYYLYKYEQK